MSPGAWSAISIALGNLLSLGCLLAAFRVFWRKRTLDDCPTSKTQGVFIGLAELKGTAESETPLTSYLAGVKCVLYSWQVEEHWSRVVHETYTDSKGHTHSRTRTESGWKKIAGGGESIPFYLKDATGVIRIVPDGADIHDTSVFNKTCSPGDSLYFSKAPKREIANTTHRRRFRETAVPLHARLYVMGQARERKDVVAAEIARDKKEPVFLISMRTEKQLSTGYLRWFWFWLVLGLLLAIGGAAARSWLQEPDIVPGWQSYVIAGGGFALAFTLGWVWTVYNSLINLHHRVQQGWSQVDIQLNRRHDLIPNLVTTINSYRTYESDLQQLLSELRNQVEATPPGASGPDFKGIAPTLQIIAERYPDLKASESFLRLQKSLTDTEQRIALARDYFNNIATAYNNRLEIIPDRFIAALAGLKPRALMSAADFERAPIQVSLAA